MRSSVTPSERVVAEHRQTFVVPGTHFVTVRVAAHRDGDPTTPYGRLWNLARARVVTAR